MDRYGTDALRWWFAREVSATSDTDFTVERLVERADDDLANGVGNAVHRIVALVHRYRDGRLPQTGAALLDDAVGLVAAVERALADFDRRGATQHVVRAVGALNRHIESAAPWALAKRPAAADEFDRLIDGCARTLLAIAGALRAVTPALAERIVVALGGDGEPLPAPAPVFPRIAAPDPGSS